MEAVSGPFALPAGPRTLNIDHHASNDHFARVNLVDVTSAASAELVSRVIDVTGKIQPTAQELENKKSFLEDNSQTPRKVLIST